MNRNKILRIIVAIALIAFALVTIFMSSSVLFDWFGIRAKQGNYVPFIVWTNFVAGFLYLISAYGILKSNKWAVKILIFAEVLLILAFIGLSIHIDQGRTFELQTIKAMLFRITVTLAFTVIAYYQLKNLRK